MKKELHKSATIANHTLTQFTYDELEEAYFDHENEFSANNAKLILLHLGERLTSPKPIDEERCPWVRVVILVVRLHELRATDDGQKLLKNLEEAEKRRGVGFADKMKDALEEIDWMTK